MYTINNLINLFSDISLPLVPPDEDDNTKLEESLEFVELFENCMVKTIQIICSNQAIIMQNDSNKPTTKPSKFVGAIFNINHINHLHITNFTTIDHY